MALTVELAARRDLRPAQADEVLATPIAPRLGQLISSRARILMNARAPLPGADATPLGAFEHASIGCGLCPL